MTDQDNLRERIERQLCMFFDENYDGHLFDASQAIVDELGLTVDRAVDTDKGSHDKRTGIITNGWKYRVVGKWERNELER